MGIERSGDEIFPSWINSELLEEVLSAELKEDITVNTFNIERAVPKGENYLSVLYRVEVEYKGNNAGNYFLIIKSLPEGDLMKKFLTEMKGFQKEAYMYTYILPAMYRIMKSSKRGVNALSAKCLPCVRENIIVLEDLKHLGYKMAVRKQGLDLEHCILGVRTLARFHAASISLYKIDPSIRERYGEGIYREVEDEEENQQRIEHTKKVFKNLASTVESWHGYEKYGEKLRDIILTCRQRMIEIVKPKMNSFNVLNHGDCWTNNMLFRYNDETGKVEDVRFVDFQIARYTSPAVDLQYLMCNCPNDEVRFQHRDTLLREYYTELVEYCKAMNVDSELISFQELKREFEEKNYFGFITACTALPVILAEADDMPDTKELKEEDRGNFTKDAVSGKRYREVFQKLLVYYEEKGIL